MYFDIDQLDGPRSYKLLTATVVPRPIAWVVSADAQGVLNAAPFSFFNFFSGFPPVVCLGIGQRRGGHKDTLANLQARGEFVINLVSEDLVEAMNITAVDFPPGEDELAVAGLATLPSHKVSVPRIAASPVALECRYQQALPVDRTGHIVIAHVVAMHIRDDAVLNPERCHVNTAALKLVGRLQSPGGYVRCSENTFTLKQMDYAAWVARQAGEPAP
ncbi:MAG: flavin reductase family protein [Burkholderiales bacterium]|nr:flavin reductase family protein [Burkholderiales bacterium]